MLAVWFTPYPPTSKPRWPLIPSPLRPGGPSLRSPGTNGFAGLSPPRSLRQEPSGSSGDEKTLRKASVGPAVGLAALIAEYRSERAATATDGKSPNRRRPWLSCVIRKQRPHLSSTDLQGCPRAPITGWLMLVVRRTRFALLSHLWLRRLRRTHLSRR